ncbi:MAG: hypothetical protein OXI22_15415 [Defluviicoccus sp.]|nr:hypothetical protein [Defluviicoccus sp.]
MISKPIAILLGLALALGACSSGGDAPMAEDEGGIRFTRNSSFENRTLRVFLTLPDIGDRSVNQFDDGTLRGRPAAPIPGHAAAEWDYFKQTAEGTSQAFALVSYDAGDPADYLMMGWWLEFPGQWRDRAREGSIPAAIVDGPGIDPSAPRDPPPVEGRATYTGRALGLFTYVANWGPEAPAPFVEEYGGTATIEADFAAATLSGRIGDIHTRRGILADRQDHVQVVSVPFIDGYELDLGAAPLDPNGTFESDDVRVRHRERTVAGSKGGWGGAVSGIPDGAGNPRLVAGAHKIAFEEDGGSTGVFHGAFIAPSEELRADGPR